MALDYMEYPAVPVLLNYVENTCLDGDVQTLWDNLLHICFRADEDFLLQNRHREGGTEPNNAVRKMLLFTSGWVSADVLFIEIKRPKANLTSKSFSEIATTQLDDYTSQSANQANTVVFGAVGFGNFVQFYRKVLPEDGIPNTPLITMHTTPLHLERDAASVQDYFKHFRNNVHKLASANLIAAASGSSNTSHRMNKSPDEPSSVFPTSYGNFLPPRTGNCRLRAQVVFVKENVYKWNGAVLEQQERSMNSRVYYED